MEESREHNLIRMISPTSPDTFEVRIETTLQSSRQFDTSLAIHIDCLNSLDQVGCEWLLAKEVLLAISCAWHCRNLLSME